MKKLTLVLVTLLAIYLPSLAQNKGVILKGSLSVAKQDVSSFDTTAYADTSAWVEIGKDTTTKGIILPRVDVNSFTTGKKGVFVYDVNDSVLYHLDGTEKLRYLRQKDLAGILGQYIKQDGNAFADTMIIGTIDTQLIAIKTSDTARILMDRYGRIRHGDVFDYREIIDTILGNNVWDTAKRFKWDYEHMKAKGFTQFLWNNTDSNGAIVLSFNNNALEGGTGLRLATYGREGYGGRMWGNTVPYSYVAGNPNGGIAQIGVNGWADLVIGATGNNHSNIYFGSGFGVHFSILGRGGLAPLAKKYGGVCVNCNYGRQGVADFQVNGNTMDSGKHYITEMPYLPDSIGYNLVGHMPNTGLLGRSAVRANSTGLFIKGNLVDTGTVTITSTPTYTTGGYRMLVHNNTTSRLETVDSMNFKNYQNLVNKPIYNYTPTGSADPNGQTGDVTYDNTYMYIKTQAGWRRTLLQTF